MNQSASAAQAPHGGDIFILCKRFQSDVEPYMVQCLLTESRARDIANSLVQPHGIAERRAIKDKLAKSVERIAPMALKYKDISPDAHAYLVNWVRGTLVKKAKPELYSVLSHRWQQIQPAVGPICLPVNSVVVKVTPPALMLEGGDVSGEESSNEDAPLDWRDS
jgi:hypothetical protein